jgi:hypothetical protein
LRSFPLTRWKAAGFVAACVIAVVLPVTAAWAWSGVQYANANPAFQWQEFTTQAAYDRVFNRGWRPLTGLPMCLRYSGISYYCNLTDNPYTDPRGGATLAYAFCQNQSNYPQNNWTCETTKP